MLGIPCVDDLLQLVAKYIILFATHDDIHNYPINHHLMVLIFQTDVTGKTMPMMKSALSPVKAGEDDGKPTFNQLDVSSTSSGQGRTR